MEWDLEARIKLAREVKKKSLEIQSMEFARGGAWADMVERSIKKIMEYLGPLGFERADRDWRTDKVVQDQDQDLKIYGQSETHLWFETAQSRVVKIRKDLAEKTLFLGLP